MKIARVICPHFNERPAGEAPSLIVLHADASKSEQGTLSWLADPRSKVSYHTYIGRKGEIWSVVPVEKRAWHAGKSEHEGRANVNDFSVGLCFANAQNGVEHFTDAQYSAGALYLNHLLLTYPSLSLTRVTTHEAVARPRGRKSDPGPFFEVADLINRTKSLRPRCEA